MIVVTCPKCEKKLNLPRTVLGRRVRCVACQAVILVPAEPEESTASAHPPLPAEPGPLPPDGQPGGEAAADAGPGLQCAKCGGAAVRQLPPNQFSRNPGYVCAMCRAFMRPAGSTGKYSAILALGAVIVLLGLGLCYVASEAARNRVQMMAGGAALAALGLAVVGWAVMQLRLPIPLGAEAPPRGSGSGSR
jgi:hypothetical protein